MRGGGNGGREIGISMAKFIHLRGAKFGKNGKMIVDSLSVKPVKPDLPSRRITHGKLVCEDNLP